jgi:hypothetical protein
VEISVENPSRTAEKTLSELSIARTARNCGTAKPAFLVADCQSGLLTAKAAATRPRRALGFGQRRRSDFVSPSRFPRRTPAARAHQRIFLV